MEKLPMKAASVIYVAAVLAPLAVVAQEWKSYPYPDPGFAIQFPTPPSVETSTFKTPAGLALPMTRYSVRQEQMLYRVDVIDYSNTDADGPTTIADMEKSLGAGSKVTVASDARVNRAMGRELSLSGADGSRSAIALFFVNKHLYVLDGEALPPNALANSSDAVRFQESLQFVGQNGGFGGAGGFGGQGRFRGGFNPRATTACAGKSVGDTVQLDTPGGTVTATCTLIARPNQPDGARNQATDGPQQHAPDGGQQPK
jgi:hypothetical protein